MSSQLGYSWWFRKSLSGVLILEDSWNSPILNANWAVLYKVLQKTSFRILRHKYLVNWIGPFLCLEAFSLCVLLKQSFKRGSKLHQLQCWSIPPSSNELILRFHFQRDLKIGMANRKMIHFSPFLLLFAAIAIWASIYLEWSNVVVWYPKWRSLSIVDFFLILFREQTLSNSPPRYG